jgi:phosphate transport system substrate-binding protein
MEIPKLLSVLLITCLFSLGAEAALEGKLVITGSSTVAPLALEIAKKFEKLHPGTKVDVHMGGSSRGILDTRRGLANIGMVSRGLKQREADLKAHRIAQDGLCIIVHKSNRVPGLSNQQIIGIYQKKITNWKDVGGKDAPITVVHKAEGRSTLELFLKYFQLKNRSIKPDIIIGDNQQGIKIIGNNPNAIGYVSVGAGEYSAGVGVPLKLLPLANITPSIQNIKNGSFPLARDLNFVTKGKINSLASAFIEYAQSSKVHDVIKDQYFIPISP